MVTCRNVHDITLSYCFFKVEEDEDTATDDSSNGGGVKLHGPGELPGQLPPGIAHKLSLPAPSVAAAAAATTTAPAVASTAEVPAAAVH